jgi:hypothetical protein
VDHPAQNRKQKHEQSEIDGTQFQLQPERADLNKRGHIHQQMKKRPVRERRSENSVKLPHKIPRHQRWYQTQRGIRKQLQQQVAHKRETVYG